MTYLQSGIPAGLRRESLIHSVRTAVAAVSSLYVARLCKLPEAYWAAVTTIVVMQSSLGAALAISGQRLAGTALGAAAGALTTERFGGNPLAFGAGVFVLGILCAVLHLERNAYRYAGITLAIVMLVSRDRAGWVVASHRFGEVSIGIVVGLVLTGAWPERSANE
ncbi:MAG: FUSC family protein [Candidatus Acidiferrales bacterium]